MNTTAHDVNRFEENIDAFKRILAGALRESMAGRGSVLVQNSVDDILKDLNFDALIAQGNGDLPALAQTILNNSIHLHHPRYMGHQVAVPMLTSVLGDLINGVTNNGMAVYEMGPAGTAIERGIMRWMLAKAGPAWNNGDGVLTHGGSLANLSALLAARARVLPNAWRDGVPQNCVILASEASHYSIARAAAILGIGSAAIVKIPVDHGLCIKPEALNSTLKAVRDAGKTVIALVANAGSTPTGSFDPLRKIGEFCRDHGIWLHIDGAHGASALVSERYRNLLDGLEFADSMVWDTHKMLGTSVLCGAVLFRKKDALANTYAQHAPYLFSDIEKPGEDLSKNTFECTKAMLGLKLFFNLAAIGERGLAAHVDHLIGRTQEFYELIRNRPGFECLCEPQFNILCFRYGSDSAMQDAIRQRLVLNGTFYITRTTIAGEAWLRIVIMNPLTTDTDIAALCDSIAACSTKITN